MATEVNICVGLTLNIPFIHAVYAYARLDIGHFIWSKNEYTDTPYA